MTRHHIISKCMGDLFKVLRRENVTPLDGRRHQALHQLFTDDKGNYIHEPKLQLKEFLNIISPILGRKSFERLLAVTNLPDEDFYKHELLKTLE